MSDQADEAYHHEHRFKLQGGPGTIVWCEHERCVEMRVVTFGKYRTLRRLNADELVTVTAHMMEAIGIGRAMQVIHGRERGLARARAVLGYRP